jgi:hypothetical protein
MPQSGPGEPPYDYAGVTITVRSGRDFVRTRPTALIGSTDSSGLHALLRYAVEGLIGHYRILGLPLNQIAVRLKYDGSATVISYGPPIADALLDKGHQLLERELHIWEGRYPPDLFIVTALSARLCASASLPHDQRRTLIFEQGVLQSDEVHGVQVGQAGEDGAIRLRFWPDFTILEPGGFDYDRTLVEMRTICTDDPSVIVNVMSGGAE